MINFLVLLLSFLFGCFCQRSPKFPRSTGTSLNLFVIYVSLPCLIMAKVPSLIQGLNLSGHWWVPVSMMWLSFVVSWIVVGSIGRRYQWSPKKTGALILTAGLGNTSFVGFPLLEALLGPEAISIGILADQPGSFLILSTLGLFVAASHSGESLQLKHMMSRLLLFPPFVAIVLAVLWTLQGLSGFSHLSPVFERLSLTLVPLALFVVGFQTRFQWSLIKQRQKDLLIGLSLKLLLIPGLCFVLYSLLIGLDDFFTRVALLEAAMATQITSAVIATEFELDSELANLMVSLSIPLSLVSVPLWNILLG